MDFPKEISDVFDHNRSDENGDDLSDTSSVSSSDSSDEEKLLRLEAERKMEFKHDTKKPGRPGQWNHIAFSNGNPNKKRPLWTRITQTSNLPLTKSKMKKILLVLGLRSYSSDIAKNLAKMKGKVFTRNRLINAFGLIGIELPEAPNTEASKYLYSRLEKLIM